MKCPVCGTNLPVLPSLPLEGTENYRTEARLYNEVAFERTYHARKHHDEDWWKDHPNAKVYNF